MKKEKILVSICCATYNHGLYIRSALEGFVNQKTNFKYEILIHDDASTDDTTKIIKEYEKKYPELIKPIYQKENQYSKGIKVGNLNYQRAKGKYIAVCEGDDYWIDNTKLQQQVDYMESHPECTFCFHNANILDVQTNQTRIFIPYLYENKKKIKKDGNYNMGELESLGFIPTASFFFKRNIFDNPPEFYHDAIPGDNSLKLLATSYGYAHCIDKAMSVYRVGTGISVMDSWKIEHQDLRKKKEFYDKVIQTLKDLDEFTKYKYTEHLNLSIKYKEFDLLYLTKKYKEIKSKNYKEVYKNLSLRRKIIIKIKYIINKLFKR